MLSKRLSAMCAIYKVAVYSYNGPSRLRREVSFGECAAGAGLEVALEARRAAFAREFHYDDNRPRSVVHRVTGWPSVVPLESFIQVRCAAYIVPRWISVASQYVDKSSADALHEDRNGIFRACEND